MKLGYVIGFSLVAIALLCNRWIIVFYTSDEQLIQLVFALFVVMLLNYTFALPGYVYLNAVGGTGKTLTAEYVFVIEKNNVLYHYPIHKERFAIGKLLF